MSTHEPLSALPLRAVVNAPLDGRMKAYVFTNGGWYSRYDWGSNASDGVYRPVQEAWGLPAGWPSIRAALRGLGEPAGCVTLIQGSEMCHYDTSTDTVVGEPRPLSEVLTGLPASYAMGVDAALEGRGEYGNYIYFFKGNKYIRRFRGGASDPTQGERDLSAFIGKGIFPRIDTAFNGEGKYSNIAYFVYGTRYLRYDWTTDKVDGPLLIAEYWPELAPTLFDYFPVERSSDISTRIIDIVRSCDGISHRNQAHRLAALVGRGVDLPSRNIEFATNCGTTALGVIVAALGSLKLARKTQAWLLASYESGRAISDLMRIGKSSNAWIRVPNHTKLQELPEPGDLLFYATGNNEHVEWLLSAVHWEPVQGRLIPMGQCGGGGRPIEDDPDLIKARAALASAIREKQPTADLEKKTKKAELKATRGMSVGKEWSEIHQHHSRPLRAFLSMRRLLQAQNIKLT